MTTDHSAWARGAVRRLPNDMEYRGLSYEGASRRAMAICEAAVETGRTINAARHLAALAAIMEQARV